MRKRYSGGSARLAALVAAAGIALSTGIAAAQAPANPPQFVQVPLTAAMVQSFIASYGVIKEMIEPIVAKYNITVQAGLDPDTANLTLNAARSQLNATAALFGGYPDYQTWVNTAMSVTAAVQQATGDKQLDPGIVPLLPTAPGADAAPVQATQVAAAPPPSDANVEAVRPYLAPLETLLTP